MATKRPTLIINGTPIHYVRTTVTILDSVSWSHRQLLVSVVRPRYAATDVIEEYRTSTCTVEEQYGKRTRFHFSDAVLKGTDRVMRVTRERLPGTD